jgi:hypothetical protein
MEQTPTTSTTMTKGERESLLSLVRRTERVAKTAAGGRAAELLADFEAKLAARYEFDQDSTWKQAYKQAEGVVAQAQAQIIARCEEMGIPAAFAPGISMGWYRRGENAVKERRGELRKVAQTRVAALAKAAQTEIERRSLEVQATLIAGGLASSEAQAFLSRIPSAEALMPPLDVAEIDSIQIHAQRTAPFISLGEGVTE